MTIPNTLANLSGSIQLSLLDENFTYLDGAVATAVAGATGIQGASGVGQTGATGIQGASGATGVAAAEDSLGYNQTWQNVTASRANATTYTNTTGKPIQVNININCLGGPSTFAVSSITVGQVGGAGSSSSVQVWGSVSAIVPHNATYRLTLAGVSPAINSWSELRT